MADVLDSPHGHGGASLRRFHDDGDGTHSKGVAAHQWIWDTGDLEWVRNDGSIDVGTVTIAEPVTVDGTVAVSGPIAVTGTFWQATQPVSGTFWQATQPVSAATLPLPSGAATEAKQDTGNTALSAISGKLPSVLASDRLKVDGSGVTQPVSGTVTANAGSGPFPVSDNAGSLTVDAPVTTPAFVRLSDGSAAITTLPVSGTFWQATQPVSGTFWQATQPVSGTVAVSGSVAVTGTFWQATQPVSIAATVATKEVRAATPTTASVGDSATSVTLLAANANRLGAAVYSESTAELMLKLGATASATSYTVRMREDDYYEVPFGYTGVIDAIWASDAGGIALVTEVAA